VLGCPVLFWVGVQPPNDLARWTVGGAVVVLLMTW